jgi:hypothetical protein
LQRPEKLVPPQKEGMGVFTDTDPEMDRKKKRLKEVRE